mmetsp:Transcript_68734/g.151380  ORF Transcript_68734/g.151380 Transcript_68734/m.151380 type:complete len:158 (+) Transcript_68734:56-529(+)
MTASLEELKEALMDTLQSRGVLGQVKAKVRAEIFAALDDEKVDRPQIPRENAIINELIREYLEYNGYFHTLSVLLPETGHPEERQFGRNFLASELRLREDDRSRSLPLIYGLVRNANAAAEPAPCTEWFQERQTGSEMPVSDVDGDHLKPMIIQASD